jgi:hypothetical protein
MWMHPSGEKLTELSRHRSLGQSSQLDGCIQDVLLASAELRGVVISALLHSERAGYQMRHCCLDSRQG